MKYRIVLTLYIVLDQGQVNRNFRLVLNEMGAGRTSRASYFHSPDHNMLCHIIVFQLSKFVADERQKKTIYPTSENVFSWTRACAIEDVSIIIFCMLCNLLV